MKKRTCRNCCLGFQLCWGAMLGTAGSAVTLFVLLRAPLVRPVRSVRLGASYVGWVASLHSRRRRMQVEARLIPTRCKDFLEHLQCVCMDTHC